MPRCADMVQRDTRSIAKASTMHQTDQLGKSFLVSHGLRTCVVCDQSFTPQAAAQHAMLPCCPSNLRRKESQSGDR